MRRPKKLLSLLTALALCLSYMVPTAALADAGGGDGWLSNAVQQAAEQAGENSVAVQANGTMVENAVAEVTIDGTTTQYDGIDEAFAAAQKATSATVKLLADVTINHVDDTYGIVLNREQGEATNFTLDLNGKTISQKSGIPRNSFYPFSAVFYLADGSLTIQDSSGDKSGKIVQPNGGHVIAAIDSTLTVESGTIENTSSENYITEAASVHMTPNCAIWASDGAISVNGGTLSGINGVVMDSGSLTVTGGTFTGTSGNALIVYGGTAELSGGSFNNDTTQNEHSIWVADGKASDLLANGYRYQTADGKESLYSENGNGVVGNTEVKLRPANEYAYIDASGKEKTQANCTEITETTDDIAGLGWYAVKENVTISSLNISGQINLILRDEATLTVSSVMNVTTGASLNLYWQSAGSGKLIAKTVLGEDVIIAPAGEMKKTAGENGTTFEKCLIHDWGYGDNKDGTHTAKCKLCGKEGSTTAHSYTDWSSNGADGHTGKCVCGAESSESHALTFISNDDGLTHSNKCSKCGYVTAAENHSFTLDDEYGKKCACGAYLTASYNSTDYASVASAVVAAKDGGTVKLLKDVGENITIDDGMDVSIDLNEKTWTTDGARAHATLTVNGGSVTVENGTLETGSSSNAYTTVVINGGSLTVGENMTVQGNQWADDRYRPAIEVVGGKLTLAIGTKLLYGMIVPSGKTLADCLPNGTALNDGSGVIDGFVQEKIGNLTLTVVEHQQHSFDEQGKCVCGYQMAAKDSGGNYYVELADALERAEVGSAVTMLADANSATVSSQLKLDCNGHIIGTLTIGEGIDLDSLLLDGYAFKSGNNWITGNSARTFSDVTTAVAPIKSVTANNPNIAVKYGESYTLSTTFVWTGEPNSSDRLIEWAYEGESAFCSTYPTLTDHPGNKRTIDYKLDQNSKSGYPAKVGTHVYVVTFTKDGYSKSCKFTVTIEKGDSEATTAPTAIEDLVYNGSAKELVTAGGARGGTMQYSLDGKDYSADIPTGTDAKEYTVWYKAVGDKNHNDSQPQSLKVTIAPKTVDNPTIEVASGNTFNGQEQAPVVTVKDGDAVIDPSEYTVSYSNNINAGEATVTITDKDGGNYIVSGSATFNIAKVTPVVSAEDITVTYTGIEVSNRRIEGTATFNGGNVPGTWSWKPGQNRTHVSDSGKKTVVFTPDDEINYKSVETEINLTINRRPIAIEGITVAAKEYDGTTKAVITDYGHIRSWFGDNLIIDTDQAKANYTDANAGTGKTVEFSGFALSGSAANDYVLSGQPESVKADITPRELTLTGDVSATSRSYEAGNTSVVLTGANLALNGLIDNETLDVELSDGTIADANVGSDKPVTCTATLADGSNGGKASNYTVRAQPYVTVDITPAPATITVRDKSVYVGDTAPDLSSPKEGTDYEVSGLMGKDELTTAPVLKYIGITDVEPITPDTSKTGEVARIAASGADAGGNYKFTYVLGKLTVSSRPVTPSKPARERICFTLEDEVVHGSFKINEKLEEFKKRLDRSLFDIIDKIMMYGYDGLELDNFKVVNSVPLKDVDSLAVSIEYKAEQYADNHGAESSLHPLAQASNDLSLGDGYELDGDAYTIQIAVRAGDKLIGYLTGFDLAVAYEAPERNVEYTYTLLGGKDVSYDSETGTYAFTIASGDQFAVAKIANATLDKRALAKVSGSKTVKVKAGKGAKLQLKAVVSESGNKVSYKKKSGNKKVKVSKSGKVTIAKGLKPGKKYLVTIKATVGKATKTIKLTIRVAKAKKTKK